MENKLPSNLEGKLSNLSVDYEGDLCDVDKITYFSLSFIPNIKDLINREILKTTWQTAFVVHANSSSFDPWDYRKPMYNHSLIN